MRTATLRGKDDYPFNPDLDELSCPGHVRLMNLQFCSAKAVVCKYRIG
jgi:hypothetical protein